MAFPLAGVLAPVLTGFFYPLVDVAGIIVIDLAHVCAGRVGRVPAAYPVRRKLPKVWPQQGSVWQEMWGGLRFLIGGGAR